MFLRINRDHMGFFFFYESDVIRAKHNQRLQHILRLSFTNCFILPHYFLHLSDMMICS